MATDLIFIVRSDTTEGWNEAPFAPFKNEVTLDTTKKRLKIGDGNSKWKDLPYVDVELIDDLASGGTTFALTAEQGKVLKGLLDQKATTSTVNNLETTLKNLINQKANTTTVNTLEQKLNSLQQIVENMQAQGGGPEVVNNCTTDAPEKALSATQGKVLNESIQSMKSKVDGLGVFGMGYTIDSFNGNGKPTQITFEDGVVCNLNWVSSILMSITAKKNGVTTEVMTINYDTNGRILGRTISHS